VSSAASPSQERHEKKGQCRERECRAPWDPNEPRSINVCQDCGGNQAEDHGTHKHHAPSAFWRPLVRLLTIRKAAYFPSCA